MVKMKGQAPRVIGLILAGGEGRRMGYRNKGLMELQGKPLVRHVAERISPQVDALYLSANADIETYEALGFRVIPDENSRERPFLGKGPLAGISALLSAIHDELSDEDLIQVVSCDGPFLPLNLVEKLRSARESFRKAEMQEGGEPQTGGVFPRSDEREHYIYLQACAGDLRVIDTLLMNDDLRIRALLKEISAKSVHFPSERAFANCNSPDELARLEEDLRKNEKL